MSVSLLIQSTTTRHGTQGVHDGASKQTLENEFGTKNEDDVIIKILETGEIQDSEVSVLKAVSFFQDTAH